jgi:hypothetical protein
MLLVAASSSQESKEMAFIISNSLIQEWQRCKREAKIARIDKVFPKEKPSYFIEGDMVHRAIEAFMLKVDTDRAINSVIEEVDPTTLSQEGLDTMRICKAKATGIMDGYKQLYGSDLEQYEAFQTEKKFNIILSRNPKILYQVTIDLLAKTKEGWWVIDHKTADTISDDFLQQASISSQTLGYAYAARKLLGEWPIGIVYNIVGKTRIRPYKRGKRRARDETLDEFCQRQYQEYQRHFLDKNHKDYKEMFRRERFRLKKHKVKSWLLETREIAQQMYWDYQRVGLDPAEANVTFYKNTGSCFRFQKPCKYLPICSTAEKITAATRLLYDVGKEDPYISGLKERVPTI